MKAKVRGGLGEGDSAWRESRVNLIHKVAGLRRKGCINNNKEKKIEAKAPLCTVDCAAL